MDGRTAAKTYNLEAILKLGENENPFFIASKPRRIAIRSRKRHQEEWYSDNHRGLPVGALSALCIALHGQRDAALVGLHGLAPARAPQILNTIAMRRPMERVD